MPTERVQNVRAEIRLRSTLALHNSAHEKSVNPDCLQLRQRLLKKCDSKHHQAQFRHPEGIKLANAIMAARSIIERSPVLNEPHQYLSFLLEAIRLEKASMRWGNEDEFALAGMQTVISLIDFLIAEIRSINIDPACRAQLP